MAKGISAIIATIMLLMITIALIGVFYAFSTNLVGTTLTAGTGQASATTDRMLKSIAVSAATCKNTTPSNNIINFTLQNIGTKDILAGELKVFVNDVENMATSPSIAATGLAANAQMQVGVLSTTYSKTRNLKVQGPANAPITYLTC